MGSASGLRSLGLDMQLALYTCYELHYRGFAGVDPDWEWNAGLLHLRSQLERVFLAAVRDEVGSIPSDVTAVGEMDRLSIEPVDGTGPSYYLRDHATWEQMREYFVHRSLYHLKEGDPHAWLIPGSVARPRRPSSQSNSTNTGPATARRCTSSCSRT